MVVQRNYKITTNAPKSVQKGAGSKPLASRDGTPVDKKYLNITVCTVSIVDFSTKNQGDEYSSGWLDVCMMLQGDMFF